MAEIHAETRLNQEAEDLLQLDPDTLDKKLHYRWARNSPGRLSRLHAKGYRIVSRSKDKVKTVYDGLVKKDDSADDTITTGDVILVCKPKEAYEKGVERRRKFTESKLESPEHQFESKARERSGGLERPVKTIGLDKSDKEEMT